MPSGFDFSNMGNGGSFHFSSSGGGPGFSFRPPTETWADFERGNGGFEDFMAAMGDMGGSRSSFSSGRGRPSRVDPFTSRDRELTPEITTVEKPLPLALEEMFHGVTKKMKIKRKTFDASGKQVRTDQILEVPIKAGLKKGSKIKFNGVGDQVEGGRQDLHFIIEEVSPFQNPVPALQY
jgi:DnaJ family protein B protein 4